MAVQTQTSTRKPTKRALPALQSVPATGPAEAAPSRNLEEDSAGRTASFIEPERRCMLIAEAAFFRAERRGFEPGHELEDWLAAESDIDGMLTRAECPVACSV